MESMRHNGIHIKQFFALGVLLFLFALQGCAPSEGMKNQDATTEEVIEQEGQISEGVKPAKEDDNAKEPEDESVKVWDMGAWTFTLPEDMREHAYVEQESATRLVIKSKKYPQYCAFSIESFPTEDGLTGGDIGSPRIITKHEHDIVVSVAMRNWTYFGGDRVFNPDFNAADTTCDGSVSSLTYDEKNDVFREMILIQNKPGVTFDAMIDDIFYNEHESDALMGNYASAAIEYSSSVLEGSIVIK